MVHFNIPHGLACSFTMIVINNYIKKKIKLFFKVNKRIRAFFCSDIWKKNKKLFQDLKVKDNNKFYIKNKKNVFSQ